MRRVDLTTAQLEGLATAGATDGLGVTRREALWAAGALAQEGPGTLPGVSVGVEAPALPGMTDVETAVADVWATGVSTGSYPTQYVRDGLTAAGVLTVVGAVAVSREIEQVDEAERAAGEVPGTRPHPPSRVAVGGVVTHRQRPGTAGGVTFLSLEDETGILNVVCSPGLWQRFRKVARGPRRSSCAGGSSGPTAPRTSSRSTSRRSAPGRHDLARLPLTREADRGAAGGVVGTDRVPLGRRRPRPGPSRRREEPVMPPRLTARTMLWTGVGLAVGSALVQNVGLMHLTYAFAGTWFVGVLLTVLQVAFTGGVVLAAGRSSCGRSSPTTAPRPGGRLPRRRGRTGTTGCPDPGRSRPVDGHRRAGVGRAGLDRAGVVGAAYGPTGTATHTSNVSRARRSRYRTSCASCSFAYSSR